MGISYANPAEPVLPRNLGPGSTRHVVNILLEIAFCHPHFGSPVLTADAEAIEWSQKSYALRSAVGVWKTHNIAYTCTLYDARTLLDVHGIVRKDYERQ